MKLRNSLFAKTLAFLLMLLFAAASCISFVVLAMMVTDYDVYSDSYRNTSQYEQTLQNDVSNVDAYYQLSQKDAQGIPLSYAEASALEYLKARLYPPVGSNIVWALIDTADNILLTNLASTTDFKDQIYTLTDGHFEQYENSGRFVVIGLRSTMQIEDEYYEGMQSFSLAKHWFVPLILASVFCTLATLVLFSFLMASAGHKAGTDEIVLNSFDRIWLEIMAACILLFLSLGGIALFDGSYDGIGQVILVLISIFGVLLPSFSLIRRGKAGMLLKTSFLYIVIRFCKTIIHHMSLLFRVIAVSVLYGLLQVLLITGMVNGSFVAALFWLLSNMAVVALACAGYIQYIQIRKATDRMASGELGQVIDENTTSFFRHLAHNLNSTRSAMNMAVEKATQSERMKTDLITNVSHDIKTPLTSIINYVDLLKTTTIADPKALEYIDILDRKSRRLAQLMADLVEASKVTSGNISVNMETINLGELVKQASGEFESRLNERGIRLICTMPEQPVLVYADGRHMWRVIDNLFGNAAKYALDNTRIYLDITEIGADVLLSVKNISRDPLNIHPDELMERFVRGDVSRHTDGSGLGLSIAKSLMELQYGSMNILIDGDLFKVILSLKKSTDTQAQ